MKIDVPEFLSSFRGENITYIPNPGNAGDALIAAATYQMFDRIGLSYCAANRRFMSYAGEFLIYGGGGNFGHMRSFSTQFLSRVHKSARRVVILPHTIKDVSSLLKDFGSNVDIICREQVSYDYVKSSVSGANVYIAGDMALGLNVQELLSRPPTLNEKLRVALNYLDYKFFPRRSGQAPSLQAVKRLFFAEQLISNLKRAGVETDLYAYRTDGEKTAIKLPNGNIDVSEVLSMGVETKALAYFTSYFFLSFLNRFERIHTNRLHVCIGAALLGKSVDFHGNDYYKCRAVYEYSLAQLPNVSFVNDGG